MEAEETIVPTPYTPWEIETLVLRTKDRFQKMISDGTLKTTTSRGILRIPASEVRRIIEEEIEDCEQFKMGIALALATGIIEEFGLDELGSVVYRRV